MPRSKLFLLSLLLALWLPNAAAAELGFYGWGFRVGVADDPDQVILGIHQDLGEFVSRVGFQPSFELGFGDDHTVVAANLPVFYRFKVESSVKPYAGGGIAIAWVDRDLPRGRSESEIEISPFVAGGATWPAFKSSELFLELSLGGDPHSAKVVLGWMLRAR